MGTVTYAFEPDDMVYVITSDSAPCPSAIIDGIVLRVRIAILATGTMIEYDVQLDGNSGTTPFLETDVFASLADAQTEYGNRLSGSP